MPKDWDTVALVYNKEMLDKAGVTVDELRAATWNPKDGGSFEKILAKLSLDANGKRGDEAGFDPKNVVQYGLITPEDRRLRPDAMELASPSPPASSSSTSPGAPSTTTTTRCWPRP